MTDHPEPEASNPAPPLGTQNPDNSGDRCKEPAISVKGEVIELWYLRRYPMMAVSWYSQPGVVLLDPGSDRNPWWTCSRPGEHHESGRG